MKQFGTFLAMVVFSGIGMAAAPTVEISKTGTTNGTSIIFTFEVKNGNVSAVNPVAELTVNGNVINAASISAALQNGVVTVTVNGSLAPGMAAVKVKANLNTGGTVTGEKNVDFKNP